MRWYSGTGIDSEMVMMTHVSIRCSLPRLQGIQAVLLRTHQKAATKFNISLSAVHMVVRRSDGFYSERLTRENREDREEGLKNRTDASQCVFLTPLDYEKGYPGTAASN